MAIGHEVKHWIVFGLELVQHDDIWIVLECPNSLVGDDNSFTGREVILGIGVVAI